VAIVGPSRSQLGLSAGRIQQQLSAAGLHKNVENFSIIADGRNIEWAIIDELYKGKNPKILVVAVDESPYPFGHPAFKYVAPARDIVLAPSPFLHNYLYDLSYLPYRKIRLFFSMLFPTQSGLTKDFDENLYAGRRTDFTHSFRLADGRWIPMERRVPRSTLLAQLKSQTAHIEHKSRLHALAQLTETDDHDYIAKIQRLAASHGSKIIFIYMPMFDGPRDVSDRQFLEKYGAVVDNSDLVDADPLYEGWAHFNNYGAQVASDRLAAEIASLYKHD
jgi:hypothetical protein